MKKILLCFLAAMLMLSILVAAPQVGPPLCSYVGGVCEEDTGGMCNDPNMMVYEDETNDCSEPGKLCCVPETCEDFGGFCDISCGSDYARVAEGKCSYEDVCCRDEWISGPDAEGNLICRGSSMQTKYNPAKIKEVFGNDIYVASCEESGSIYPANREYLSECDYGEYTDGGRMYGEITVDSARRTIKIEKGGFTSEDGCDLFGEYFHRKPTEFSITADTITISFANKTKPRISVSGDGAIKWGDVFFGCQKKDANGRAASCSLTAEMNYLESEGGTYEKAGNKMLSLNYVNVNGLGFISELDALQTYINRQPDTIDKLKEEVGREFVAMPLSNLKSIKLFKPLSESRNYPYTISIDTASDGSSAFNYLKIKSITGNDVNINDANIDAIGNMRGMQPLTEEIKITPWHPVRADILVVTADAARVSGEKQDAFSVEAGCGAAAGLSRAKVNVFIGNNKLLEATQCNRALIVPPAPAGTGIAIAGDDFSIVRLSPSLKEIKVIRDIQDYGDLSIWMLQGYENFVLENPPGTGSICDAIPNAYIVTNPRNNNRLELSDELINIVPEGKLIPDLGFSFTAELCNGTIMETLACKKTGECALDGSPVFGVTAAPMREVRGAERTGRRFEEGAKGIGEGREDTLGQKCDTDEDCGAREYCNLAGRERVCVLQEQRAQGAKTAEAAQCGRCGEGTFNICDKEECTGLGTCSFQKSFVGGVCSASIASSQRQLEDSAKSREENACRAAGGICRDICYRNEFKAYAGGAPHNSCRLIPIAGQPIEQRWCCLPNEEEEQNSCEILGGTCSPEPNCGMNWFKDFIGGNSYRASLDSMPEASIACGAVLNIIGTEQNPRYSHSSGNVCCLNAQLCEYLPCD